MDVTQLLITIFGEEKNVDLPQMCARAVVMFVIALVLVLLAGLKTFGKNASFDNVISIVMGAMLSRGIAGDQPFASVVLSTACMVLMTRIVSWAALANKNFGRLVKGQHLSLFKKGVFNTSNMQKAMLSEADIMEGVRKQVNYNELTHVEEVFIETSGEITVVKKQ